MEAEYKQHVESDSSEDDESNKLDEKGKELKKLVKKGAPEYVPPPKSPESKDKKKTGNSNEPSPRDDKPGNATKKSPSFAEQNTTKIRLAIPQVRLYCSLLDSIFQTGC